MSRSPGRFDHWPTGTKLLLLLTAALLPLGLALVWTAWSGLSQIDQSARDVAHRQALSGARAVDAQLVRTTQALKVAANGAIRSDRDSCGETRVALALTPDVDPRFSIRSENGSIVCTLGDFPARRSELATAPGTTLYWISPPDGAVYFRSGVIGGMITGSLSRENLARYVRQIEPSIVYLAVRDGDSTLPIIGERPASEESGLFREQFDIGSNQLTVEAVTRIEPPGTSERAGILLPLLMLVVAVILSWYLVRRLLLLPLGRLQRTVNDYQPGGALVLPERLGSAEEIRSLGASFERAVDRIEESEREMTEALGGQRRLVREVHHRVKNNLQVIASMLSIHGRSADTPESRAAYAAMGRRVDALSVVHRNHFAEVEETRGIALRPMMVELAATLRASSPDPAHPPVIQLDVDNLYTTQDAAVAVSFFVTEIVEYAMLKQKAARIEVDLRRVTELNASLTVATETLVTDTGRGQFDRVVTGLARQLRSPLEEKMGRLGVNLPVFPTAE